MRACVRECMCTTHMKTGASQSLTTRQSWLHVLAVSPDLAEEVGVTKGSDQTQRISLERQQQLQTTAVPFHPLQHTYTMSQTVVSHCTTTDIHYVTNGWCLLQQTYTMSQTAVPYCNRHTMSQTVVSHCTTTDIHLSLIHISEPTRLA